MGEGGMITTDDSEAAAQLRLLRQHGMSVPDTVRHASNQIIHESYVGLGYNYRLTDIQAAMGLEQLKRLESILELRHHFAARYDKGLAKLPGILLPMPPQHISFNYQSYAIRLTSQSPIGRDKLMQTLLDRGIATRPGVMTAHTQPAYSSFHLNGTLPISEKASSTSLFLPLYPTMTHNEQDYVIESLHSIFKD